MGKSYNAPQITLTQKAHYQHISQFPILCTSCRTEFCTDQQNRKDYRDFYFRLRSPADPTSTREVAETTSGPTLPNRDYRPTGKADSRLSPTSTANPFPEIDFRSLSFLATRTYVPHGQQCF